MIHWKIFFDQQVNNGERTYDNIRKIKNGQWDNNTTGCLPDYPYFKKTLSDDSNRFR